MRQDIQYMQCVHVETNLNTTLYVLTFCCSTHQCPSYMIGKEERNIKLLLSNLNLNPKPGGTRNIQVIHVTDRSTINKQAVVQHIMYR